jgi:hypothetical protein
MSLGPVTPNVHIFKICQDAPKKNGASFRPLNRKHFFLCREPAHAKYAATDRYFQPKLIGELSCLGNIVSRGF